MKLNKPLELEGISEGTFMQTVKEDFNHLQSEFIKFCKKYGVKATGSKAIFAMKITLIATKQDGFFAIKPQCDWKLPSRPFDLSAGFAEQTDAGDLALFVKASGSDDNPHQQKLCTDEGKKIDIETGEIVEEELE